MNDLEIIKAQNEIIMNQNKTLLEQLFKVRESVSVLGREQSFSAEKEIQKFRGGG